MNTPPPVRTRRLVCMFLAAILLNASSSVILAQKSASGSGGVVATAHPLASAAGQEMLERGGNAVDAAVAAAFAIGVVEPDGSGLGGGGAIVLYDRSRDTAIYIDFYQQAGRKINDVLYNSETDRGRANAVLVPGNVAGLTETLDRFGTLSLSTVLGPAIRYAVSGFVVDTILAGIIADNEDLLRQHPLSYSAMHHDGHLLGEGDTLRQPGLAGVLGRIAREGRDGFYGGAFARKMVEVIRAGGGEISLEDLAGYHARFASPVAGTYRGLTILSAGPPQSGISVVQALQMLDVARLPTKAGFSSSPSAIHIVAEVLRRVYADRVAYVSDPAYGYVPVQGLLSREYATERFGRVRRDKADPPRYRDTEVGDPGSFERRSRSSIPSDFNILEEASISAHTTHISVIDGNGMAVALTQTLGTFFGSGVSVEGVFLNDGRANFSGAGNVNEPAPGKRPRSTIAPTILIRDGIPYAVIGTPGGMRIIATLVQLIVGIVDGGQDAVAANDEPRFFCQKFDNELHLEGMFADSIRAGLESLGHPVRVHEPWDHYFGGAQIIVADSVRGLYTGSADRRRSGAVRAR